MKFRTTLIFALVLAVLGAYVYFYEYKKPQEKTKKEEEEKKVLKVNWDKLKGLTITNANGSFVIEKVKVKKGDAEVDRWRISSPVQADAENATMESLVTTLKNLKVERVIAEEPNELGPFGLSAPRIKIRVELTEGEQPPALLVGNKSPVGYNCYAMVEGEKKILLAGTDLGAQFDKKLHDLREKKLFEFGRDDIEKIAIVKKGERLFELEKKGERWDLVYPLAARAAETEVNKIVNKLTGLRAETFEDETGAQNPRYGLGRPEWRIDVTLAPDHALASLSIGKAFKKDSTGYVYAAKAGTPTVVSLKEDLVSSIDRKAMELREKKVLPFKSWEIRKIEIALGDEKATLVKDEQSKWKCTSPVAAKANASKVTSFLTALSQLEAKEFISPAPPADSRGPYGLDKPLAAITLYEKEDKKVGTVRLGQGAKAEQAFYADTEGGDVVCEIQPDFIKKDLPKNVGEFRERRFLDFYRYQVARIDVADGDSKVVIEKKGGAWKLLKPHSTALEDKDVDGFLSLLSDLETERFVAEEAHDLARYGLDKPAISVKLANEKGDLLATLAVSSKGPEEVPNTFYAKEAKDLWVGLVKADSKKKIQETLASLAKKG